MGVLRVDQRARNAAGCWRRRLYSLILLSVADWSELPMNLSTAARSSRLLLVKSWLA